MQVPLIIQFFDIKKFFDSEVLRDGMNAIHKAGIKGKIYRLWFNLNRNIKIKVRTACGTSDSEDTGEGIGQGTIGGAIVSAATLDDGVSEMFETSNDEICYGNST